MKIFLNKIALKHIFKILMSLFLSLAVYILLVEFFSLPTEQALSNDITLSISDMAMHDIEIKYGLNESASIFSWISNLAIYNIIKESDSVITSIYFAIYLMFLIHIATIMLDKYFSKSRVDSILTFTTYSASGLGTLGTMYAIAIALHSTHLEITNLNEIIQRAFFDAIYTTIIGLSISLLNQGISIFAISYEDLK